MYRRPRLTIRYDPRPTPPNSTLHLRNGLTNGRGSNQDDETIGHMNFIKMFLSGKLAFPGEQEQSFSMQELIDIESLGNGSYGTVRRMRHESSGREMAVKRVRIINSGLDEAGVNQSMKRLRQEVEAIRAASNCDHIVRFFGLTFHEGDAWVCMELMDISLEHLYKTVSSLSHATFDETVLGAVAISVIKALTHMKDQHHIIHRDVKPSNILLNRQGDVKVCDFGICGYLQDSVAQTREAGCRPYMAPEKLSYNSNYDIRSDVWSLGVSMVEVANFAFPYPGFNEAPIFAQLEMVVNGDPPMLHNKTSYTTKLHNFINMCVIKDYTERPHFSDLMKTNYYTFYERMENINDHVSRYVTEMLPLREELKKNEHVVA